MVRDKFRIGVVVVGLLGCHSDKSGPDDDGLSPNTHTLTDTGPVTTPAEDCDDGFDNDGDGLLDCEDGDCFADAACAELVCDDGIDNDDDGLADCEDEDCWGNGCTVVMARLNASLNMVGATVNHMHQEYGSPACSASSSYQTLLVTHRQPQGSIKTMTVSATTWNTCDWQADSTTFAPNSIYGGGSPVAVNRNGLLIEPGCPLATTEVLPQYLFFQLQSGGFDIWTGPDGDRPIWFDAGIFDLQAMSPTSITWNVAGSPCNAHYSQYTYGNTFLNVLPGAPYWTLDSQ